jgi:hypothetical protein
VTNLCGFFVKSVEHVVQLFDGDAAGFEQIVREQSFDRPGSSL